MLCVILITCSSCSEFALLASGSSIAISQNAYVKAYNSVDVLTIVGTNKSVQKHAYESIKDYGKSIELKRQKLLAELEQLKKGKKYIYDKTWGLTHN